MFWLVDWNDKTFKWLSHLFLGVQSGYEMIAFVFLVASFLSYSHLWFMIVCSMLEQRGRQFITWMATPPWLCLHVAVLGGNRTLFHCVFQSHSRVCSALAQNFCGRAHTHWVNSWILTMFTQLEHYEHGNVIEIYAQNNVRFLPRTAYMGEHDEILRPLFPAENKRWVQTSKKYSINREVWF